MRVTRERERGGEREREREREREGGRDDVVNAVSVLYSEVLAIGIGMGWGVHS